MFRRRTVDPHEGELLCPAHELVMRSERDGHVHVIELIGELDMNTAPAFDAELHRVERSGAREIVIDLGGVQFIGSDGVKALIHAVARSRERHTRLRLLPGSGQVQRTFETAGLTSRLPFDSDRDLTGLVRSDARRARLAVSRPVRKWRP